MLSYLMKFKIILSIILSLLLFNPSYAKWGKGPLKLSQSTMEFVLMYMYGAGNKKFSGNAKRKNDPDMMAISTDGRSSYYYYCPAEYRAQGCLQDGLQRLTILGCEKESNGTACFIFAKKRRIVWKNGGVKLTIKKKDLKSPYLVAKKIKDAEKAIRPAVNSLIKMKCNKIILGCTELPIAIFAFKSFQKIKKSKTFLDPNLIMAHSSMKRYKDNK